MRDSDDPDILELQQRIVRLANKAIDEAFDLLEYGTPHQRLQLISRFGGHMVKALGSETDDGLEGLRNDFIKLVAENRGPLRQSDIETDDQDEGGWASSA